MQVARALEHGVSLHLTLVLPAEARHTEVTLCEALLSDVACVAGDDGVLVEAVFVAAHRDLEGLEGLEGLACEVDSLADTTFGHASRVKVFAGDVACVTWNCPGGSARSSGTIIDLLSWRHWAASSHASARLGTPGPCNVLCLVT